MSNNKFVDIRAFVNATLTHFNAEEKGTFGENTITVVWVGEIHVVEKYLASRTELDTQINVKRKWVYKLYNEFT
jgi:hypothetical protein